MHEKTKHLKVSMRPANITLLMRGQGYLQFDDHFYEHLNSVLVGYPVIANIFVENLETRALNSIIQRPKMWVRYVDDTYNAYKGSVFAVCRTNRKPKMSDSEDNPPRDAGRSGIVDREGIREVLRQLLHGKPSLLQPNPTDPKPELIRPNRASFSSLGCDPFSVKK